MNIGSVIIILAILVFILFMLNHVSVSVSKPSDSSNSISSQFGYVQTPTNCSNVPGCCSLTKYGCCPDGVNSRADFQGSNCPLSYNPGSNPNIPPVLPPAAPINPNTPLPPPTNIIKPLRL